MALLSDYFYEEEIERNKRAISMFERELKLLPKGSIQKKKSKNKEYYFLVYRENKKVKSKHIPISENIKDLQEKIDRRKKLEEYIKFRKKENEVFKKRMFGKKKINKLNKIKGEIKN